MPWQLAEYSLPINIKEPHHPVFTARHKQLAIVPVGATVGWDFEPGEGFDWFLRVLAIDMDLYNKTKQSPKIGNKKLSLHHNCKHFTFWITE